MPWTDIIGYLVALAVLGNFCMNTIVPSRTLAVISNMLFGLYGMLAHLWPVFFLHSILLPINLLKLAQAKSCVSTNPRFLDSSGTTSEQVAEAIRMVQP